MSSDAGEWPHDPDGEAGSEGGRKYGQAILAKKVDEEDFPLSAEEFLEEYGDHPVRLNHERVVGVAEVFEHVDAEGFETMEAFHRAVGAAMRRGGMWEYRPGES